MAPAKVKPAISPELLDQIDVRVGTIESVNDVAKSDKLLALRVNFGDHLPTVHASGAIGKEHLAPVFHHSTSGGDRDRIPDTSGVRNGRVLRHTAGTL
jgi:hypothetical protein